MGQGGAGAATTGDGEKGALPSLKQVAERTSHSELAMSPSLLAFNRYQQQQREELKNPGMLAAARDELKDAGKDDTNVELELQKVIGKRWKNLNRETKDALIAEARGEQAKLVAKGGVPAPSNSGRGSKSKRSKLGPDGQPLPKRSRGRPRKTASNADAAGPLAAGAPAGAPATVGATGTSVPGFITAHQAQAAQAQIGQPLRQVMSTDGPLRPVPPGGENLIGHVVEGVVDGAFDVGYFLTVRANGCLLRGIIWKDEECVRAVGANAQAKKLK